MFCILYEHNLIRDTDITCENEKIKFGRKIMEILSIIRLLMSNLLASARVQCEFYYFSTFGLNRLEKY